MSWSENANFHPKQVIFGGTVDSKSGYNWPLRELVLNVEECSIWWSECTNVIVTMMRIFRAKNIWKISSTDVSSSWNVPWDILRVKSESPILPLGLESLHTRAISTISCSKRFSLVLVILGTKNLSHKVLSDFKNTFLGMGFWGTVRVQLRFTETGADCRGILYIVIRVHQCDCHVDALLLCEKYI